MSDHPSTICVCGKRLGHRRGECYGHKRCACGALMTTRSEQCRACFETGYDQMTEKACTKCRTVYPVDEFAWRPDGRGGHKRRARCRRCESAAAASRRKTHPERVAAATRAWEAKNPERVALGRLRRAARILGLDPDEVVEHFKNHDGLCDICRRPPSGGFGRLTIDHCHERLVFRGLLCNDCNLGVGKFGDDPARLRAAADYIERAKRLDDKAKGYTMSA